MAIIVVVIDEDVLFVVKCFMPNGLKVCIAVLFVDSGPTESGVKICWEVDKTGRVLPRPLPPRVTDKMRRPKQTVYRYATGPRGLICFNSQGGPVDCGLLSATGGGQCQLLAIREYTIKTQVRIWSSRFDSDRGF